MKSYKSPFIMNNPSKSVIVGTAGHIDHGKSTLVEALTGTHPDRLAEEKRRGITIDLGFAFLEENGVRFGFVDVPGHERFVSNMLAGAAGIDVLLLVIAADESIKPQTREHFDICRLLGVKRWRGGADEERHGGQRNYGTGAHGSGGIPARIFFGKGAASSSERENWSRTWRTEKSIDRRGRGLERERCSAILPAAHRPRVCDERIWLRCGRAR